MKPQADSAQILTPLRREELGNTPTDRDRVLTQISAAKISGLGGGRFDTASKLRNGFGAQALIINGLQSEPGNNSDMALLHESPQEVIAGAALAAFVTNAPNVVLALPDDAQLSSDLSHTIDSALSEQEAWLRGLLTSGKPASFACRYIPAGHASGEEHQLATALELLNDSAINDLEFTRRPLVQFGIVCINLATAYAIARAVYAGEPLSRRMISINGKTTWVELGTPLLNITPPNHTLDTLWINGRHGGNPANSLPAAARIHPGVFCIDTAPAPPVAPCINCSACVPACPVGLRPDELYQQLQQNETPPPHLRLGDCIECGACNDVCPSGLWLAQLFRGARAEQTANTKKDQLAQKAKARSEARTTRLAALEEKRAALVQTRSTQGKRAW